MDDQRNQAGPAPQEPTGAAPYDGKLGSSHGSPPNADSDSADAQQPAAGITDVQGKPIAGSHEGGLMGN